MIPKLPVKAWIAVAAVGIVVVVLISAYMFTSRRVVKASSDPEITKGDRAGSDPNAGQEINENQEKINAITNDIEASLKAKDQVAEKSNGMPANTTNVASSQQDSQLAYEQQYLKALQSSMRAPQDAPVSKGNFVLSFKGETASAPPKESNQSSESSETVTGQSPPPSAVNGGFACGNQKNYWSACLPEGNVIRAVTTNQLSGDFTGPLNARVTETVLSRDRNSVLIPAGSVVLGESGRVGDQEQARLAIVFHLLRLETDNAYHQAGWQYRLDKQQALSPDGSAGETANVNRHWTSTLLAAGAFGALAGFSLSGTGTVLTNGGWGVYRQGLSEEMGSEGEQMMSHFLNRLPTLSVPVGRQVDVYLSKDLVMR